MQRSLPVWADMTPRPHKVEQLPWTHRWRPGNTTRHAPWQMKSLKLLAIAGGCCQHHDMRAFFLYGINLTQGGWHASHASACVLIPWWSFSNPFSNPFSNHFWLPWWRPRENHLGAAEISNVPANAGVAWEELAPPTDSPDGCFGDSAN